MPAGLSGQCLTTAPRQLRRHATCRCACIFSPRSKLHSQSRELSTTAAFRDDVTTHADSPPRWKMTPPRMTAPFRSKPYVLNNEFPVNEDPAKLDQVYMKVLGNGGDKLLTEEVKWLAVTHKSFDHGRRGYNDRLAFFGTDSMLHMIGSYC